VAIYFKYYGLTAPGNSGQDVSLGVVEIYDEKGREQRPRDSKGGTYHGMSSIPTNKAGERNVVLHIPLTGIPRSAGRLTLKTSASIDDCWPLPVSVVVRK
jgi:hypothetical protein